MSTGVEAGVFAIIGAVVGAVGAALTAITQSLINFRTDRAKAAADAAAHRAELGRADCELLIGDLHDAHGRLLAARALVNDPYVGFDINTYQWDDGGQERGTREAIYQEVTRIRIDGSERASRIAQGLQMHLTAWTALPPVEKYSTVKLTEMIGHLEQAEEDLIMIARDEAGA